ncbi:hypothetical protein GCM10010129_01290 [Streptomyces fumigatiscleroticus]|nr:hypothetical protein GCM10010129_01290 [Streptomyces fumigatiscleroticus]
MRRLRIPLTALAAVALILTAGSVPAAASSGEVVVFGTEVEPVTTYQDPSGCYALPLTAHVLVNRTDGPVQIYGDPFCMSPSLAVQPGFGSHLPGGSGSFSAG